MAVYITFKEKAIEFAKQAVEQDEKGEYEKASQLYLSSLEYFKTYLKYEKNQMCRDAVTAKVGCCRKHLTHSDSNWKTDHQLSLPSICPKTLAVGLQPSIPYV